jgi:hypothetical protein
MKRMTLQLMLFLTLFLVFGSGYLLGKHLLNLPFRATNDALHEKDASFTLDFLIPSGKHIDAKMTIGDVLRLRIKKESSLYEKMLTELSDMIPAKHRFLGNLLIFLFWTFLFMTFFRVFTFMNYGRAVRGSLFFGALTYYFMPDFSSGILDDTLFMGLALFIIIVRMILKRRRKRKDRIPETGPVQQI